MEVKGFTNIRLGFDSGKEWWYQGGADSLRFYAAEVHLYHGRVSGGYTHGSHIPEQQLLKVEHQSIKACIQSSWADHLLPTL